MMMYYITLGFSLLCWMMVIHRLGYSWKVAVPFGVVLVFLPIFNVLAFIIVAFAKSPKEKEAETATNKAQHLQKELIASCKNAGMTESEIQQKLIVVNADAEDEITCIVCGATISGTANECESCGWYCGDVKPEDVSSEA